MRCIMVPALLRPFNGSSKQLPHVLGLLRGKQGDLTSFSSIREASGVGIRLSRTLQCLLALGADLQC